MPVRWRREWLIELARYHAGELRLDQLSEDALVVLAQRDTLREGDEIVVEHNDGTTSTKVVHQHE